MENNIYKINFATIDIPKYSTTLTTNKKWVYNGDDNLYPQRVIEFSSKSTTFARCFRLTSQSIAGEGWKTNNTVLKEYLEKQDEYQNNSTLLERISSDLALHEGFALQIVYGKDSDKITRIYHIPFDRVRAEVPDSYNGIITHWYVSGDWSQYTKHCFKPQIVKSFDPELNPLEPENKSQLFVFSRKHPANDIYPVPQHHPALYYAGVEYELGKLHYNSVLNGMMPSLIVEVPSRPSPEERRKFKEDFKSEFQGSEAAGSFVLMFNENPESAIKITPLQAANNVDLYHLLTETSKQKIIEGWGLTSPTLAGLEGAGSLGGNANEIMAAYDLYQSTVIESFQQNIIKSFKYILKHSKIEGLDVSDLDIEKFKPVKLQAEANQTDQQFSKRTFIG